MHDVARRCDMNYVRSKDAQKQLARTSLSPSVKSKHSRVLCAIKGVPALLQTAVSFYTPYSVNEKSSLLLCLLYCLYLSDHDVFFNRDHHLLFQQQYAPECTNGKAFHIAASPQVFATLI